MSNQNQNKYNTKRNNLKNLIKRNKRIISYWIVRVMKSQIKLEGRLNFKQRVTSC